MTAVAIKTASGFLLLKTVILINNLELLYCVCDRKGIGDKKRKVKVTATAVRLVKFTCC